MKGILIRAALPGIVLAMLVLLPMRDRAFTIDDTFFLMGARHAVQDPLHPTAYEIAWRRDVPDRVGTMGGLLMDWILIPVVVSPRPETTAHLIELGLFILAIGATVSLALRLGLSQGWATVAGLLLASTPTALALAGTAMSDVPAMAFGILGLERIIAWREQGRWTQAVCASVALCAASLARPHAVLYLGIGALLVVPDLFSPSTWFRRGWKVWAPLPMALGLLAAVVAVTWDHTPGAPGITGVARFQSASGNIWPNAVAFLTHFVLAFPLAIPWILLRARPMLRYWWVLPAGAAGGYALTILSGMPLVVMALVAGVGVAVLWDIVGDAWSRRDGIQMILWVWLLMPLVALPYEHLPAKFTLAAAPAIVILIARQAREVRPWIARAVVLGSCTLGVALGIAILVADGAFSDLGRRAAAGLVEPFTRAGVRVWYAPRWGFQWYAERAGARPLTSQPPFPEPGDLVVASRNTYTDPTIARMVWTSLPLSIVGSIGDAEPGGRVMTERAGFYSNTFGPLPWTWGVEPLDTFWLLRVEASSSRR